jgi:23S rRNA (adenine2503-C2)-methyltransferase
MRGLNTELLNGKRFLKDQTLENLSLTLKQNGFQSYRAKQIFQAVYGDKVASFDDISTIPKDLRTWLDEYYIFESIQLEKQQISEDGTMKFLFTLADGAKVETVLIPSEMVTFDTDTPKRRTLCISTQAGCPLGCKFCATATLKLQRNLETAEIVDQFIVAERLSGTTLTNIVFMGMGEPMLNYENVMSSVERFTMEDYRMLSPKRITLSTAGIVPGIMQMADEKRPIKLALSLHATTNGMRQKLMPIANKYSIEDLGNALEYYYRSTKIPVTFEYILFDGINDSELDVQRLARLSRRVPTKVNVIPFHEIEFTAPTGFSAELKPTSKEKFALFIQRLKTNGVQVMIRSSSGLDIDAACGQLAFSNAV